jgi:hypothetical protein
LDNVRQHFLSPCQANSPKFELFTTFVLTYKREVCPIEGSLGPKNSRVGKLQPAVPESMAVGCPRGTLGEQWRVFWKATGFDGVGLQPSDARKSYVAATGGDAEPLTFA